MRLVQRNNMNAEYSLRPLESSPPGERAACTPSSPMIHWGPERWGDLFIPILDLCFCVGCVLGPSGALKTPVA